MEIKQQRESRRDPVRRIKVRDQAGVERWLEEATLFSRTRDVGGEWSEWVKGTNQFFTEDGAVCVRHGDREFTPVMSREVLTAVDRV